MGHAGTSAARPGALRTDAARNRDKIIECARRAFAAEGLEVAMDTIAKDAGVGAATLYRRFPHREDLVEACMDDRMEACLKAAMEAATDPDPWEGFVHYLTSACEMQASDRGVNDLLTRSFPSSRRLEKRRREAYDAVGEVMGRAQDQGRLRPDVTIDDVPLLLMANAGIVRATFETAPEAWRRVLGITIDGLRTAGNTPLASAPSRRQLLRTMVRATRRSRRSATPEGQC